MASRNGPMVSGTDGNDYQHRETIVSQYYISAQTKSRLKWTIMFHYLLSFFMLLKLLPEIFDKLDIFLMELEELYIPKPLLWEWLWLGSIPVTLLGLSACKKSSASNMRNFFLGTVLLGVMPIIVGFMMNFSQVYLYVTTKKFKSVDAWNGYPVAVLWYFFLTLLTQVHCFELYYSKVLIGAWQPKKKTH